MSQLVRTDDQLNPVNEKQPYTAQALTDNNLNEEMQQVQQKQDSTGKPDSSSIIQVDDVYQKLNTYGPFQMIILFTFNALYVVLCAAILYPSFYLLDPSFICPGKGPGFTEDDEGCNEGCYIDTTSGRNIITDSLDLYCGDTRQLRIMSISILYIGCAFGNIVIGAFSEVKGRRIGMIVTWFFSIISLIGVMTSYSITQLMIFEFLLGFFINPASTLIFVYISEVSIGNARQYFCVIIMIFWAIGELILPAVAYYEYNWRYGFLYYMLIPSVAIVVLLFFFMHESPQFLLSQRRFEECRQVFYKIAKTNKKPNQNQFIDTFIEQQREQAIAEEKQTNFKSTQITSVLFHQIFLLPKLLKITGAASGVLLSINIVYFGCQFSLGAISDNIYMNQVYLGIAEALTLIVSNFTVTRCKRKIFSFIFHTTSCVLCLFFLFIEDTDGKITVAFFVRIFNVFAMCLVQIYLNELFPTPARAVCQGIVYFFGLVGSIVAPYIIQWALIVGINQVAWLGIISFIGSVCCFFLKETHNMPLDQELEETDLVIFKKFFQAKVVPN